MLGVGGCGLLKSRRTFLKQILYSNPNDKQREEMIKGNTIAMKKNIMDRIHHLIMELEEEEMVSVTCLSLFRCVLVFPPDSDYLLAVTK